MNLSILDPIKGATGNLGSARAGGLSVNDPLHRSGMGSVQAAATGGLGSAQSMGMNVSAAAAASGTSASTSAGAITSNDFLTLLVTEMKNQDPTAASDPNAYVNQLTQINSLQQLISINQNLQAVLNPAPPPAPVTHSVSAIGASPASSVSAAVKQVTSSGSGATRAGAALPGANPVATSGNLSMPKASAASGAIGHALDGMHSMVARRPAR